MEHLKFASIEGFRQLVASVQLHHDYKGKDLDGNAIYEHTNPYPLIAFNGTLKADGTNTSIVYRGTGKYTFQSREQILEEGTEFSDMFGFRRELEKKDLFLIFHPIKWKHKLSDTDTITVYGEWCGRGINSKAAISQTEGKKWIIFAIKVTDANGKSKYLPNDIEYACISQGIYNILQWPTFEIILDFNDYDWNDKNLKAPEWLMKDVNTVTNECPIAKSFGAIGMGEGIVFIGNHNNHNYRFKLKGDAYEKATTPKEKIERTPNPKVNEFLDLVCTENRLEQGWQKILEKTNSPSKRETGDYVRWFVGDVLKECYLELNDLGLSQEEVQKPLSAVASKFYLNKVENG